MQDSRQCHDDASIFQNIPTVKDFQFQASNPKMLRLFRIIIQNSCKKQSFDINRFNIKFASLNIPLINKLIAMDFESLVGHINRVQDILQRHAAHAINLSLTARNWFVGYYIVEFEQHGEDRAKYGENLFTCYDINNFHSKFAS